MKQGDIHRVEVTNEDGSVDVYETDGINPPTKNGVPIKDYWNWSMDKIPEFKPSLPKTIRWSEPINPKAND